MPSLSKFFHVDSLTIIMWSLVSIIGLCVASFSSRYLKGDRKQKSFYFNMLGLSLALFIMTSADNIWFLFTAWGSANLFLTRLMLHKHEWQAAVGSAQLAFKNFALGLLFIGIAFLSLYHASGQTSIQKILNSNINQFWLAFSGSFILLGAMTQSALWPFHRWLISSLNSPTPVSAIMHSGLINGGGFLLARFAPIFLQQAHFLNIIFIIGIVTAVLGTLWKLMQNDIKRMLACSTMGQMGFMLAQCGLGLFPAAIAHLCWHGFFKAYLFLSSSMAAQERRLDFEYPPQIKHFLLALIYGGIGAAVFAIVSNKSILIADTNLFLTVLAMLASTQLSLSIIRNGNTINLLLTLIGVIIINAIYGFNVYFIELALAPLNIDKPQAFNLIHGGGLIILIATWLAMLFGRHTLEKANYPQWALKLYVRMLNYSQPHPKTVTAYRKQYKF